MNRELHEANRRSWNAATAAHNSHKGDQAAFFRTGGGTLHAEERELLGDIAGLSVVHLQCNCGQDTLSLARLGAAVTGVDISDDAIEFARRLSVDSGIVAAFERADVLEWLEEAAREGRRWDVAFTSYGVLTWLSDIRAWGRGVAGVLKPGGRVVVVEFHPVAGMFDETLAFRHAYFGGHVVETPEGIGDYVADSGAALSPGGFVEGVKDFRNPHPTYEHIWGLADVVQALLDAGLALEALREFPYSNGWKMYRDMRVGSDGHFYPPEGVPAIPLMYGLAARKPGG